MGRKTIYAVGQTFGGLEITKILPVNRSGRHVKLECICHYCNTIVVMNGVSLKRRNSCGCQQNNPLVGKRRGARNYSNKLPPGQAAKNSLEYRYKRTASKRGYPYNLTTDQFFELVTGPCIYCGSERQNIIRGQGKSSGDFNYTGIDRIDSSLGYELNNCVSCCWRCNNMKAALTHQDFIDHISQIYLHYVATK